MKLNFQYSHHDHSKSEEREVRSALEALKAFDVFDWAGEVSRSEEAKKCSPTLAVIVKEMEEFMWVSAYKERDSLTFISECNFPGEVSAWFGLYKKQGIVKVSAQSFSKSQSQGYRAFSCQRA